MECVKCGRIFDPEKQRRFGEFDCSYHLRNPISIGNTGPGGDYAELWVYPCCGKGVVGAIVDGRDVTPSMSPGCRNDFHAADRARIFLSYARTDSKFALFLENEIKRRGYEVWRDVTALMPGDPWPREIDEAIKSSTHVFILLTPASVSRPQVEREIAVAIEATKPIVPILLEDCEIPDDLGGINMVDWRSDQDNVYSSNFKRLQETLDAPLRTELLEEMSRMRF